MPDISVVIPTYNRLDRLRRVVAGLERQTYPRDKFEVVVVSDGSTDGTDAYLNTLRSPLNIVPLTQPNRGVAAARNCGVQHAAGDVVLFIDDDVVPDANCLAEHMRTHAAEAGQIVLGPMLTPADATMTAWVRWEQAMLMKQYDSMLAGAWQPTARQFYTGNTSLQRSHLLAAGGFDESFRRAEDVELGYRLAARGLTFLFNPAAIGYHYAERSFRSWLDMAYSYGRNDVIFARERGQSWLLPTVVREFGDRHALVRRLVRACLDRPRISALLVAGLRGLACAADLARRERAVRSAYSGLFNLRYYQGVADELGGRMRFFALTG